MADKLLTAEEILGADDAKTVDVDVPEWGGKVRLRTLEGTERDDWEAYMAGNGTRRNFDNFRARLCAKTICDASGKRLFNDADVIRLGKKSSAALSRVFAEACKLNGITDDDVEELAKNSSAGPNGSSGSG